MAIKDLSNLVFLLLTPALLFRTMSGVHVEQLDFRPVAAYFLAVILLFGGTLLVQGFNRRAAVMALAGTFSNTVMIGIALIGLMYGAGRPDHAADAGVGAFAGAADQRHRGAGTGRGPRADGRAALTGWPACRAIRSPPC